MRIQIPSRFTGSRGTGGKLFPPSHGTPLDTLDITEKDIILDDRYHAGCYGIPDKQTMDAIKFGASTEEFITDLSTKESA
jgi:hypothetical protein